MEECEKCSNKTDKIYNVTIHSGMKLNIEMCEECARKAKETFPYHIKIEQKEETGFFKNIPIIKRIFTT